MKKRHGGELTGAYFNDLFTHCTNEIFHSSCYLGLVIYVILYVNFAIFRMRTSPSIFIVSKRSVFHFNRNYLHFEKKS